ncbi:MAG: hypothetical protein ACYTGV_10565, partial [Planctomycetota bacterium]
APEEGEEDPVEGLAVPSNEDPEVEAQVQEEVEDFFQSNPGADPEIFSAVDPGIDEEKVEEIREALDDVFEEDLPPAQTESEDQAFVSFFKQVEDDYSKRGKPAAPKVESVPVTVAPPEPSEPQAAVAAPDPTVIPPSPDATEVLAASDDIGSTAAEVQSEEPPQVERAESLLSLADCLNAPEGEAELRQRVELLCRLVGKLVERTKLPENEIIEVLIKSGIEF